MELVVIAYPLLLISITFPLTFAQVQQQIVVSPKNTSVIIGKRAILHCRVQNQLASVQWSKDGFGLGSERSLPYLPRLKMIGYSAEGDYNLEIVNVTLDDDADYQCQIGAAENAEGSISDVAHLTVLVPPSPPKLSNFGDVITVEVGRSYNVECESDGGKPAPEIRWVIARDVQGSEIVRHLNSAQIKVTQTKPSTKTFFAKSSLSYSPKKEDGNNFLLCMIEHEALKEKSLNTAAQLRIQYKPEVRVISNASRALPREHETIELTCEVTDANPDAPLGFIWRKFDRKRNHLSPVGRKSTLLVQDLDKDMHHEVDFICFVTNEVGTSNATHTVKLQYGPRIEPKSRPHIRTDEGTSVAMECEVDSNPLVPIKWYKRGLHDAIHDGPRLSLQLLSGSDAGQYFCRAESKGFKPAQSAFNLTINGPPKVSVSSRIEAVEGSSVDLVCRVTGEPKARTTWYKRLSCSDDTAGDWIPFEDMIGKTSRKRYKKGQMFLTQDGVYFSRLRISNLYGSDFGCFNCTAVNDYGIHSAIIQLVEKDGLPLYYVIPAVVAGSAVILALAICFLCLNRRYLCGSSKSSQHEDSDVHVKVEALDGSTVPLNRSRSPFPEMYAAVSTSLQDSYEYAGKEYMAVPMCENGDFDNLPPPYIAASSNFEHAVPTTSYYMGSSTLPSGAAMSSLTSTFGRNGSLPRTNGANGQLVHMTYLDDSTLDYELEPPAEQTGAAFSHPTLLNKDYMPNEVGSYPIQPPESEQCNYMYPRRAWSSPYQQYNNNNYDQNKVFDAPVLSSQSQFSSIPKNMLPHNPVTTTFSTPPAAYVTPMVTTSAPLETLHEVPTPEADYIKDSRTFHTHDSTHV